MSSRKFYKNFEFLKKSGSHADFPHLYIPTMSYSIVCLSEMNDKWIILNAGPRTIELLTDNIFCCSNKVYFKEFNSFLEIKIHILKLSTLNYHGRPNSI